MMWQQQFKIVAQTVQDSWRKLATSSAASQGTCGDVSKFADDATTSLGRHLRSLGRNLDPHHTGPSHAPVGLTDAAAFSASHGLDKVGKYLEREGFRGAASDLGAQVRKNPLPFIAAGVGLGFLVGRLLPSRRR